MGSLAFGWRANDVRESIWKDDPMLADVSVAALAAWNTDGDASHLEPFIKHGEPTRLTFRSLNGDELRHVRGLAFDSTSFSGAIDRIYRMAFRIGFNVKGMATTISDAEGAVHPTVVRESGFRMLANGLCDQIDRDYPDMIDFYGALIFNSSTPTEKEKKASSPPSTPTPSSAVETTAATTEASPPTAGA